MAATDKVFAGSIPETYDRYMVPLIFEPYALDLAGRIAAVKPQRILEIAAGTGALTRALASRLPQDAQIVATDLNQPMLDHASAQQPADPRLTWKQADAMKLPFEDRTFDVVACQFGAMFFPDKVEGYREARRMLRPGGRFAFNVWDKISENEFTDVVTEALASVFPNDPPRFMARTPHGYHDVEKIRGELAAAGFSNISADTVQLRSKAPSPRQAAVALCQGTPLRNEIETRDAQGLERATAKAAEALEKRYGAGPIDGRIQAHVFIAA